ncbi:MAG: lipid-A-disaccharide synthase, partial [Calditrichia bacterium]
EQSGDRHAADLLRFLKQDLPGYQFYGIGGNEMQAQDMHLLYHIEQMAFLGLAEVVKHLPFIFKVFHHLKEWMRREKPAALILVDYPGLNLRLAKVAKALNIPVVYYICPQLWAWGQKRVEKIRRYVDLPLVIFKFEEEFYRQHGIDARFVGHPLVDEINLSLTEAEFREKHNLSPDKPIIALLPGSRANEIRSLLPEMAAASRLVPDHRGFEWVLGKAGSQPISLYRPILESYPDIKIADHDTHHLMKYAHLAMVASGTATLETGYLQTPMVVGYRVSGFTYFMARRLVKIKNIALANIVSGKTVVPELIQDAMTAENFAGELQKYLENRNYQKQVRQELKHIRELLGPPGAADRAAREISQLVRG